jgi:hypothetical protein
MSRVEINPETKKDERPKTKTRMPLNDSKQQNRNERPDVAKLEESNKRLDDLTSEDGETAHRIANKGCLRWHIRARKKTKKLND